MADSRIIDSIVENALRGFVEPTEALAGDARVEAKAAIAGDVDKALALLYLTDNPNRHLLLRYLSRANAPQPVLEAVFAGVWDHDHRYILQYGHLATRGYLEMYGRRPANLQGKVTLWRGGRCSLEQLRRGFSWTTERGCAAWFATVRSYGQTDPLVIRATVSLSRVLHCEDARNEAEYVIAGARNAVVDGTPADWKVWADEWRNCDSALAEAAD